MSRKTQVVLLCEDAEQRRFFEGLCKRLGYVSRLVSVIVAPPGTGSAEAWVRARYPREVHAYRAQANHLTNGLVVAIDGDNLGVAARKVELESALKEAGYEPRGAEERIAACVPTWSIETWLAWLCGLGSVDEAIPYKRDAAFSHAREAGTVRSRTAVEGWFSMAREGEPPSLTDRRQEMLRLQPARGSR